jgi:Fe-S cluster assembly protein SufD
LDYSRLLLARPNNVSHHFIHATIGAKAQFNFNYVATGAKQVRQELHFDIIGESAIVNANGLYDVQGEEHHDLHCRFLHKVPNTEGHYYFKGSLRDKSHGVFTCDIDIAHQAQKTNAELLNKNLLLGERAKIDTRPQLNVFADDVKAGHGATIGRISDEELFYLESRGIDRHRAFELLCQGFVDDIFQRLPESHRLWMLQQWQIWRKQKVAE